MKNVVQSHGNCRKMLTKRAMQAMGTLVRASGLNVAGLLALVAHALTLGLSGAVARDMADFAAYLQVSSIFRRMRKPGITDSCSTSDPECSHGPCGRSHRRSSRSVGDHRHHLDH